MCAGFPRASLCVLIPLWGGGGIPSAKTIGANQPHAAHRQALGPDGGKPPRWHRFPSPDSGGAGFKSEGVFGGQDLARNC